MPTETPPEGNDHFPTRIFGRYGLAVCAVVVFVSIVLSTHPVQDGDFWWQIAYGRYLLEHRTLIPDDTIYTWLHSENPAQNRSAESGASALPIANGD